MPLTATKLSVEEIQLLRKVLLSYIEKTNHFYQDGPERENIEMFYAESEKYLGFSHPKQLSTGVREVKSVRSHRMVVPEEKFITVLKIINDYYEQENTAIKKKILAEKCEDAGLIVIGSDVIRNRDQVLFTSLDKTIIHPVIQQKQELFDAPLPVVNASLVDNSSS